MTSEDSRYEAVRSRDARFDGVFFFAVSSTGIYCRPSCPAITPKRANVSFFPTAAAAQGAGFRACRRCRPDAVPGSADWNARADVVGRAIRLIGDGIVDREGVAGLATRLGYSARQVQRQLNAELGAGPIALARAQRGHTARVLLQTTSMQAAEIAFAAGFASVRQFNETIREIYAATPTELRAARPGRASRTPGPGGGHGAATGVPLRLAYRGAYDCAQVFDHLAARAVGGVEEVTGGPGSRTYRRTLRLPHGFGVAEVAERPGRGGWLDCRLHLGDLRDLTTATQRVRRLFDLDADPYAVAERLGADPELAGSVARRPGLRAPGTTDPEEYALRAVIGDAARSAEVAAAYGAPLAAPSGGLTRLFPRPADLAEAELTEVGAAVRPVLRAVATALATGGLRLDPGADRDEAERMLLAVPGVSRRTASAIRMRALGDPDVLLPPASAPSPHWRPWRTYATHHLWSAPRPAPSA
ncbi:helix-turn-helix domain-containing protein [Streptomyces cocklensis]|uniref:Methylphosphotriester-DNA--protein-cysteine S-methyltransferase / DNA-3-methyladenine glycosylase n=1 Tax=Actinacidiphila cocklensis TaxID=887465 RepID=A0A9W4DYM3_9ACTN|nr:AlkA N-terminal domain-containing protein [Actinacidiphila cocklensis]MDD1059073.1 helix-turn-helix domain-containing protein [Actinacidiphila cocklensis]WSX73409.1 helix-turn-helix domain-containing protein [Streptomyces sp. NBC_00899]WSX80525.1 helix-turn-helix domain-containing protein [Streptomyces sp. NBC_00899]CAG6398274.1 Methylphosphotriester-DNA--protein-cysteine S-methyltransferase / DNA-3-methyladenine glycosylase [Actinacidiphila cocklensis]